MTKPTIEPGKIGNTDIPVTSRRTPPTPSPWNEGEYLDSVAVLDTKLPNLPDWPKSKTVPLSEIANWTGRDKAEDA
jgi:hypothetical protein